MAEIRSHLTNAPITEALIDLQIKSAEPISIDRIRHLADQVDGYEIQGPMYKLQTKWKLSPEDGATHDSTLDEQGLRLRSSDEKIILQVRTNGLTVSRLEPYETWSALVAESKRIWHQYVSELCPSCVTRVATRYINNLKLPMKPGEHFREYLTCPPELPDELPQGLASFLMRFVIPDPESETQANLVQKLDGGPVPADFVPIVLDIDAYKMVSFRPDSDEAWELLEKLRAYKNRLFYASLTEKSVSIYE
ncbi:MAG: TIGR04255 family protein [Candidatus Promineifilaceae bacterium]